MAQYDDLKLGMITFVGAISTILTFVIIIAAQVLYYQFQELETQRKEIDAPITASDTILDGQRAVLNGYGWIDEEKGIVSTPIAAAMESVVAELSVPTEESPAEEPESTPDTTPAEDVEESK